MAESRTNRYGTEGQEAAKLEQRQERHGGVRPKGDGRVGPVSRHAVWGRACVEALSSGPGGRDEMSRGSQI